LRGARIHRPLGGRRAAGLTRRRRMIHRVVLHTEGEGTWIGDGCAIGHLAHVEAAGIEDSCLGGIGARILNGVVMRRGAVAAAGAVVTPGTEVPGGMRAQGVPAQIVRGGTPSPAQIEAGVQEYVEMAALLARSLAAEDGELD